jgi:hypothetical protein
MMTRIDRYGKVKIGTRLKFTGISKKGDYRTVYNYEVGHIYKVKELEDWGNKEIVVNTVECLNYMYLDAFNIVNEYNCKSQCAECKGKCVFFEEAD